MRHKNNTRHRQGPAVDQHKQQLVSGVAKDGTPYRIFCDSGIAHAVDGLNSLGAETTYSCEATGTEGNPYILFKVPNKATLKEAVAFLVQLYGKSYSVVINATKKGLVGFYATNSEKFLRSWYGKLMPSSELVIIIPKEK